MKTKQLIKQFGFVGAKKALTKNKDIHGFFFKAVELDVLKGQIKLFGYPKTKPKAHNAKKEQVVYVLAKDKALRIDSAKKVVLFANSKQSVKALVASV